MVENPNLQLLQVNFKQLQVLLLHTFMYLLLLHGGYASALLASTAYIVHLNGHGNLWLLGTLHGCVVDLLS